MVQTAPSAILPSFLARETFTLIYVVEIDDFGLATGRDSVLHDVGNPT
jgi:hypothetical protein